MSRKQWGHGYYKGREDERKNPEGFRYLGGYDDFENSGYINRVAQIRESRQDTLIVEWLYYLDVVLAINGGYELSPMSYNPEMIAEIPKSEIENAEAYRFFYTWEGVVSEFIKAEEIYKKKTV